LNSPLQRSLDRSALVEATEQLTRALGQIATLPATTALRDEEIKVQVALITPLIHVRGYAAPEARAAAERARLLIDKAEALGEHLEDPLLLFSALYGIWTANYVGFNGDVVRDLAAQFLALAEQQGATVPLMVGHRLTGISLLCIGDIVQGRTHLDRAFALYDAAAHRPLATRIGIDTGVSVLSYRPLALWLLGYPDAALADSRSALKDAREVSPATSLMYALTMTSLTHICRGDCAAAAPQIDEVVSWANEKGAGFWKAYGMLVRGWLSGMTAKRSDAVDTITAGIAAWRSTGATLWTPWYLSYLVAAHAELGQFDDAWRCIGQAMTVMETTTKERWCEAEAHRTAGEIALMLPERDAARAEAYFERALAVARKQQAKSWELRAAMSMARLWRDQGKRQQAHDLLAPVYGWFTEGFDTLDLKEAKALLDELA